MIEPEKKSLTPTEDLKEVQIEPFDFHVTKLETSPSEAEEMEFVALLRRNIDMFAWTPDEIIGIYARVVYHRLTVESTVNPCLRESIKSTRRNM